MPWINYECQQCGEPFEMMVSYEEDAEHPDERCPVCSSGLVERVEPHVVASTGEFF